MRSETIYSRLFSLVFSRQGSTHKKGQNTHGNLSRLQSKQRRQLNSSLWYFLKEEKPSPSKSIATPVSRTRSCHNGVYLGSNDLNKAKCMAIVVIIRVPGNKILCLSKSRDIGGEERSEKKKNR